MRYVHILTISENILTVVQDHFRELSSTAVLPFNEPVEAMDYDANNSRLVLSSHTGKIKLFQIEKNGTVYFTSNIDNLDWAPSGTLVALWRKNWNDIPETKGVIPRCVQFTDKGENMVIFGLESGIM